jgi:hypothetical protein
MALHYYRYGERKDCSWQWDKFKFALSLSVKTENEKIVHNIIILNLIILIYLIRMKF